MTAVLSPAPAPATSRAARHQFAPLAPGDDAFVPLAAELGAAFAPRVVEHDRDNTFVAENYPTMRFVSTSFDGEELTGDLTIKDVTKPVTFEVDFNGVQADPWGNTKAGFEAEAEIKRADWGLTWNAAIEGGGVLVSDKIKIVLDVQLLKQA